MRLTSDYRRVTALFDTLPEGEIEYGEYGEYGTSLRTDFEVGPFEYAIMFSPEDSSDRVVNVEFELFDINVSDEELIQMMSNFQRSLSKEKGVQRQEQPISLQQAKKLKHRVLHFHTYDELEITGPYVIRIFSKVLAIIKDYVKKNRTRCIVFSAASEDRSRLYQRMMKSAFPGAGVRASPSPWGAGTEIRVCFV